MTHLNRHDSLGGTIAVGAWLAAGRAQGASLDAVYREVERRGYGDIEVNVSGGYDRTTTSPDARLGRAARDVYRRSGIDPKLWPRRGGSWPGYVFKGDPIRLPAGHFGLGHGQGAHAPDEYFLVESTDPKIAGIDGAVKSYVHYLFALA